MHRLPLFVRGWAIFAGILFWASAASAWIETIVRSHEVRILVERDGRATVRHDLVLKVRGGPMKVLEIDGIGSAVEPLPDATLRRALRGSASQWPLDVAAQEDGRLRLGIGAPRGIRGGSYRFDFAYEQQLPLAEAGDEQRAILRWVGPRLSSGVDSAKVTFVVPRAAIPPQLSDSDEESGVLLGEIRRGEKFDEVDLIRTHVASREPAIWRLWVSNESLSPRARSGNETDERKLDSTQTARSSAQFDSAKPRWIWVGILAAVFGVLIFVKGRALAQAARLREARLCPLVPAPLAARVPLVCGTLGGATWWGFEHRPWWALTSAAAAAALCTYLYPRRIVRPRGPGLWQRITDETPHAAGLPGGWLDVHRPMGALVYGTSTALLLVGAYRILPQSNYFSLLLAGLALLLVPLFWSGLAADFPEPPAKPARRWLGYLQALSSPGLQLELWGRIPTAESQLVDERLVDEVRIRLQLARAPSGLRALEVAFEQGPGASVWPCVLVRVLEDSAAQLSLPQGLSWSRGRRAEEKVALLRPSAPTRAQLLAMLRGLLMSLSKAPESLGKNERRSSGSGLLASNGATSSAALLM